MVAHVWKSPKATELHTWSGWIVCCEIYLSRAAWGGKVYPMELLAYVTLNIYLRHLKGKFQWAFCIFIRWSYLEQKSDHVTLLLHCFNDLPLQFKRIHTSWRTLRSGMICPHSPSSLLSRQHPLCSLYSKRCPAQLCQQNTILQILGLLLQGSLPHCLPIPHWRLKTPATC